MEIAAFGAYMREHADELATRFAPRVKETGPNYAAMTEADLHASLVTWVEQFADGLVKDDIAAFADYAEQVALQRAADGFLLSELINTIDAFREAVHPHMDAVADDGGLSIAASRRVEDFVHAYKTRVSVSFDQVLLMTQQSLRAQLDQIDAQSETIRELGTPILPIYSGIIVLPLIGAIDSRRATQVMENLLESINAFQADMVIIDITGVPVVDTSVANYLLQAAWAANLVGAQVILVGISAEIAQTMVQLGVDLSRITTRANLQAGFLYALGTLGHKIT